MRELLTYYAGITLVILYGLTAHSSKFLHGYSWVVVGGCKKESAKVGIASQARAYILVRSAIIANRIESRINPVFRYSADRLPVAIILVFSCIDFFLYFMVETTWRLAVICFSGATI